MITKKMVGLLNIRYEMSEELRSVYGDIGYNVKLTEREKRKFILCSWFKKVKNIKFECVVVIY